eukprot:4777397-Pyramimonas_sp.AAC.1
MSQKRRACKFGGANGEDAQRHYMSCPLLWGAFLEVWCPQIPIEPLLGRRLGLARELADPQRLLAVQRIVL